VVHGVDANGSGRPVAQITQAFKPHLDFIEVRPDRIDQVLPGFGGRYAAGGAGQQAQPQARLQGADGMAQRRLGNPEFGRRLGKAALTGYRQKGKQIVGVFPEYW